MRLEIYRKDEKEIKVVQVLIRPGPLGGLKCWGSLVREGYVCRESLKR